MKIKGKMGVMFTMVAAVGLFTTIYLTIKKAPEAKQLKEEALNKKRQDTGDENAQLTMIEAIQAQLPCYGPVIATTAVTFGSLIGSQIIPQSTIKEIKDIHETYKQVTAKVNGDKSEHLIEEITNKTLSLNKNEPEKKTFVFRFDDKYIKFESTLIDVLCAEYNVNKFFVANDDISFNQMLALFKQKDVERGDEFGWDSYLGNNWYGYSWIDFKHRDGILDGEPVTFIEFEYDCHILSDACEIELNDPIG